MAVTTYVVGPDGRPVIVKKRAAVLRYSQDWAPWLLLLGPTAVITAATWTSSSGITLSGQSFNTTATSVTVAGGNPDTVEWATCTVTLDSTYTEECTLYFHIKEK